MKATMIRQKLVKFKIVSIDTINKNVTVKMIELTNKRKEKTRCLLEGDELIAKLETHIQLKEGK